METSGFRPDHHHHHPSHVPQQSRRDKLRVQHGLNSEPISHHLESLSNTLDHQFTLHQDHDDHNARSARPSHGFLYEQPGFVSSEILGMHQHRNGLASQDLVGSTAVSDGAHGFMVSWSRGLSANTTTQAYDNWPVETSFGLGDANNMAVLKPRSGVAQPLLANNVASGQILSHDVGEKYYLESMNLATPCRADSHINYRNNDIMQEQVVTVASAGGAIRSENELALLPFSFANLDNHHQNWNSSTSTSSDQLGNFGCSTAKKRDGDYLRTTIVNDTNLQGLSLSLSSINSQSTLPNVARVSVEQTSSGSDEDLPKPCAIPKPSIISKSACGKSLQDIVGVSSSVFRSTAGPLGPFTGYATILKNSRFLQPAQQLLEELCGSSKSSTTSYSYDVNSERFSGEAGPSISASGHGHDHEMNRSGPYNDHQLLVNNKGNHSINKNNNSCASSSTFYGSNEINSGDHGGVGSNVSFESGSSRPDQVQQKKAKLLVMQEEVGRKYKQYKQQMHMVVSSFESVAGLSSATPYIALALKAVARHFRCLKSAIAEQLGHAKRALGEEDLAGPARLKYMEQNLQKHGKPAGTHAACPEPQQHHIWRPQRGLPERSVAVLRAWLFEHFLHPYPTDSDKHMLATQTGLTRNQVSNWFINARVRVWKPMVEEIHTLETKGLCSTDQGDSKINDNGNTPASKHGLSAVFLSSKQSEFSGLGNYNSEGDNRPELFGGSDQLEQSQEKRSRLECQSLAQMGNMAGAVVQGFVPYNRNGLEVWSRAEQ